MNSATIPPPPTVSGRVQSWLADGHAKMEADDFVGALACYNRVTKEQPDCADAHAGRALALTFKGLAALAKRAALAALAIDPAHPLALKVVARVELDLGNVDHAREYCDAILAREPADADALLMLGQCQTEETVLPAPPAGEGPGHDAYISLGNNCEAGLQFRRIGYSESSLFRFTLASFDAVHAAIRNDFAGLFQAENLEPYTDDMVRDTHSGIVFHSKLKSALDPASGRRQFRREYDFEETYGLREAPKIRHLVAKWRALTRSEQDVLYFLKLDGEDRRARAMELLALFRRQYPTHRATLLCLQTAYPAERDWGVPGLINRYLPRFAPYENAEDADIAAWDRIFAEFPLKNRGSSRVPAPLTVPTS